MTVMLVPGNGPAWRVVCILAVMFVKPVCCNTSPSHEAGNLLSRRLSDATTTNTTVTTTTTTLEATYKALLPIKLCQLQVIYTQVMTQQFLQVASSIDATQNKQSMAETILLYDTNLNDLVNGNLAKGIDAPTYTEVKEELAAAQTLWTTYKSLLESNVNTVATSSTAVLASLHTQSQALKKKTEAVLARYVAVARLEAVEEPPILVYAKRQVEYLEIIFADVLFLSFNVEKAHYLSDLVSAESLIVEVNNALLNGNSMAGIPDLTKVCLLAIMLRVSEALETMRNDLKEIQDTQSVSRTLLLKFAETAATLSLEMNSALKRFEHDDGSCDIISSIDDTKWSNMIYETNTQRMLSQKVTRTYLQHANGMPMTPEDALALTQGLSDARTSLLKCLKGSYGDNILAPPTQEVADLLVKALQSFNLFDTEVRRSVELSQFTAQMVDAISSQSSMLLANMKDAGQKTVAESLKAKPSLKSNVWESAAGQLTSFQKMSGEGLLVSFGGSTTTTKATLEQTLKTFEDQHFALLKGGDGLPRTTDACTLNVMADVEVQFRALEGVLRQLVDTDTKLVKSSDKLNMIQQVASLTSVASGAMATAVGYYQAGQGTCATTLSAKVWEISLEESGSIPFMLQKGLTEYYLLASGHAQTWLARAEAALVAHQGYIMEEAAAPILVEAVQGFKEAWNTYRGTDEERRLGLQVAYITLNPHPAGSKDALDVAVGTEQYHVVHLQYHPHYRKILYERNYYDIFMLDLQGNLIYSVYKELDYATNFAKKGTGIWKDSGLGEAFEAAMGNPDEINVIDWKPYGPSAGAYASFLSTGVRDEARRMIGVFCTQMPPESQPMKSPEFLAEAMASIDTRVAGFKFSDSSMELPPPPSQKISDDLFTLGDQWKVVRPTLASTPDAAGAKAIAEKDGALIQASEVLLKAYVTDAATAAPALHGSRIEIVSQQRSLVQGMCKQVVMIGLGVSGTTSSRRLAVTEVGTRAGLSAAMTQYQSNQDLLVNGDSDKNIPAATQLDIIKMLEDAQATWDSLKPSLESIANGDAATETALLGVVTATDSVVSGMDSLYTILATTTRTTTLMTLEILAPMPFSGTWSAGATMKTVSLLAEGTINEQQLILPGYNLKSAFFDDKCDGTESSRIVLAEMATKDTYVALGGAGCSAVCEQTAFAASTIRLPFIIYECPGAALSDTETFPEFTRFGTVTTPAFDVFDIIAKNYSFPAITVVAGDPTKFGIEAEYVRGQFASKGLQTEYVYANDDDWDQILQMMRGLKTDSKGENRVYFMVGTEDYFRKVVCASIVSEAQVGITWLSRGTFIDDWWTKSDKLAGAHRKWLLEDTGGNALKTMHAEFNKAWEDYVPSGTDEQRYAALFPLYATDEKELLNVPNDMSDDDKAKAYHTVHQKWHPIFRQKLYDRGYYDIFIFDLRGNCIYSVYKESDYATNFDGSGNGQWKDSGLGDAFRAAIAAPDNISYIDWKPYGPSAGALAAFLSTGLRDEDGVMTGVYTIQLPPDYVRSIEEIQTECSFAAIGQAMEGAINVVGIGRPADENMVKPLPCFDGHSPQSFLTLLDKHLAGGYPLGDRSTQVADPYGMMRAHAADAICVVAFTVKHLLEQGHTIQDIQRPDDALYAKFLDYVKTKLDFLGASGRVKFSGNDKPSSLVVQQIQLGSNVDVGIVSAESTDDKTDRITWKNGGPRSYMWKKEASDPPPPDNFPYLVLQVLIPMMICCSPFFSGCITGYRAGGAELARQQ
jgi:hypothetical protein